MLPGCHGRLAAVATAVVIALIAALAGCGHLRPLGGPAGHCASPAATTAGPVTTSAAKRPAGYTVKLITITGAGHQWPGSTQSLVGQRVLQLDPPSTALNAPQSSGNSSHLTPAKSFRVRKAFHGYHREKPSRITKSSR